ncbi:MAG: sugar phosphate isomerase/epimerase [Bacteroidetes bacterium]|nr:sugar phosphate isomerase/epimerase [Bacteroidota bacterium]
MKKGINYWAFPPKENGELLSASEVLKKAKSLGYDLVEFTVDPLGAAVTPNTTKEEAAEIRKEAAQLGIGLETLASGLAWGASPTHPDSEVRKQAVQDAVRQVEIAAWLGCHTILYLPGMVSACFVDDFPPQSYDTVMVWAREALNQVLPHAERLGVRLGVENVWNRFLLSPLEMRDFIDSFESPIVGAYFDVGNIMLYGHPEHWISILGFRIFAVHMKDFRVAIGNINGFVDLLAGDVCYPQVMEQFKTIGYNGPYTAEYVPGILGAAEKAIAALKLIEQM